MLIPITRETFEQLIPAIATGAQYRYYWGKLSDVLQRVLISFVGVLLLVLLTNIAPDAYRPIVTIGGIFVGVYWLWAPIFFASRRNLECRRYQYSGLWQGKVLDIVITEALIGTEEIANSYGELEIVEKRERRLNVEVGDRTGFITSLQVPLRRDYKRLTAGQPAQMVVMSDRPDLSLITKVSDIYIPTLDLWVSDYPYLRRDLFLEVREQIRASRRPKRPQPRR
ncbi:MAG TPA: phosphate ABC transporter permease [Oscillatoriaceae cyanobacterium M33_DOE_052]|uniref:Phosphate ABC transporter permease n=1 Tax=Planktothricoides sp. SpSt-374 TaxID=2282167 RepID=A0A7C3VKF3_9CYAN|nr:phosphate ABC transporter permease [Oscillatoriaceae cyanobacterium M33_DOE_052]